MRTESMLHIGADHPALPGHFPGAPIVPGVVLLDAAVHAALELLDRAGGPASRADGAQACSIASAKFLGAVGPGETLLVCVDSTGVDSARFEISCRGVKVAVGTLALPSRLD